jgi:hypothetical protein
VPLNPIRMCPITLLKYHFMCCSLSYKNEHTIWTLCHTRMSTCCHTKNKNTVPTYILSYTLSYNNLCRAQHNMSLCLTEQNGDENYDTLSLYNVKIITMFRLRTSSVITDQYHLQLYPDDWDYTASVSSITLSTEHCTLREVVIWFSKKEMKNRSALSMLRCW